MLQTQGYATHGPTSRLEPFHFTRRDLKPDDVFIKILYCGICHSDIHSARNEWQNATYPMVPGHEIVGKVLAVGKKVKKFKEGDVVGVGCFVDSCRNCESCKAGEEQLCEQRLSLTYNSTEQDGKTPTYGGYSSQIVVNENYVLRIPENIPLAQAAPLLCAGITTFSPLKRYKVDSTKKVAVIGLGGLGHMAVKFAVAMGAQVTVLSTQAAKEQDAKKLGAQHFVVTKDPKALTSKKNYFDFIIDTVSADHDINTYLNLLKRGGVMVLVGIPEKPFNLQAFSIIGNRRALIGSLIGGIEETQAMLDFCSEKGIASDVEIIPIQQVEEAYERTIKGDVRYRLVIDMESLQH